MRSALFILALAVAGCATPEEARQQARQTSSYTLCSKLANAVLAPNDAREQWAMELQSRGENCSQHMGLIRAEQARDAQLNQMARQYSQPVPAAATPTGFLKRSTLSGTVRYCVYDRLGTEIITTIPATGICPLRN